jgi:Protein of unknown function (DUF3300)
LVPFPQVLAMLNSDLAWTEQLGYAVATRQAAVLDSIQRLRRQAQKAGSLKTTKEQRVAVEDANIVIQPADPQTVHVPTDQPAEVYGEWPYPSYPPVYIPPAPAYYPSGYLFGAGLAFAAGVAVVGGLWGSGRPGWNTGSINISPHSPVPARWAARLHWRAAGPALPARRPVRPARIGRSPTPPAGARQVPDPIAARLTLMLL